MIAAIVVILAVFISADWYYYYKTRRSLDGEFGQRLAVLAELVSASLSEDSPRAGLRSPDGARARRIPRSPRSSSGFARRMTSPTFSSCARTERRS